MACLSCHGACRFPQWLSAAVKISPGCCQAAAEAYNSVLTLRLQMKAISFSGCSWDLEHSGLSKF